MKLGDRQPRTIPTKDLPYQVVFWGRCTTPQICTRDVACRFCGGGAWISRSEMKLGVWKFQHFEPFEVIFSLDSKEVAKETRAFKPRTLLYIYICCRVKTWSKICLFLSQNLVQVFSFFSFFVFHKTSSFCRENEILKKNEQKKDKKNAISWVKTWSNYVAQHTWTKFWLNLGPGFDSTILLIFGYFYLF